MIRDLPRKAPQIRPIDGTLSLCTTQWIREYRDATKGKRYARNAKALEVLMAYLAKTKGTLNGNTGLWEAIVERAGEVWATVPLFAAMLRSVQKEATKSQPLYGFRGDFSDTLAQRRARFATMLIEYLTKLWFQPEDDQEDILWAIAFGCGGAELRWDPEAGEPARLVPVECPSCKTKGHIYEADAKDDHPCPDEQCQAAAVDAGLPPPVMTKGNEAIEQPAGDPAMHRFSPFGFATNAWATKARPAVWWSLDDILDRAIWDDLHPECEIIGTYGKPTLGDDLRHLRQQRSFEQAQMGVETALAVSRARNESLSERDVVRQRDFFAPKYYRRMRTAEGETLRSGRVIDAGVALVEMFPEGMCVLRQGDEVVDIYPCRPEREIKLWNFAVKPGDRYGASIAAEALECQYNLEENLSSLQATADEMGNPTRFYEASLFDPRTGQHPSGKVPVNFRQMAERGLKDFIYDAPGASPSPVIFQLVLYYEQRMQGILGTFSSVGGGLPDAIGPTATANIKASNESASQQGMYLQLRAFHKLECLEEGVALFRENGDLRRSLSMGGPFADGAAVMVDRTMLPDRFTLELKEDSWWPRDRGQKQQAEMQRYNLLLLGNQVSMLLHGRPLDPVEERWINDICGSEIGAILSQVSAELAANEWAEAKAFLKRAQTAPTPKDLQAIDAAKESLMQQAAEAMAQQQAAAMIQNLGAPGATNPAVEPEGTGAPEDPMALTAGGVPGPGSPVAESPAVAIPQPPPPLIPEPPIEEILVNACDLIVPIRPGLTPSFRAMAGQLRLEGLKTETRELPDLYREWLDRRAQAYDELARNQRAIESGAAGPGADPNAPPAGAAPGSGAGPPMAEALLTKLASIQGGSADALGLPGSAPPSGDGAPPQIGSGYAS